MPLLHAFGTVPSTRKAKTVAAAEDAVKTAWWKCDEGSGGTLADSAGSNNLTLANGSWTADTGRGTKPTWNKTTTTARKTSPSGCDAYTEQGISVAAWIYPKTAGESNTAYIAANYMEEGEVANSGWIMYLNIPTQTLCQLNGFVAMSTQYAFIASGPEVVLNEWNHVGITFDATGDMIIDMYLNGEDLLKDSTQAGSGTILNDSTNTVSVGNAVEAASNTFDGYLDEVRIYQQKLTATQVAEIYAEG
jgi:hypothetical protein